MALVARQTTIDQDFAQLIDPYRRELYAHCYRMLGSVHDAEDQLQEVYLRAWKGHERFEGRSSLRTWLHRIATTVCLTALEKRERRPLPTGLGGPTGQPEAKLSATPEVPWLEPTPDRSVDPGTIVADRESVRLALVAALQYLPAQQRAVLILREVLRFSAAEVAEMLDTTVPAVNSLLQRARARLDKCLPQQENVRVSSVEQGELLDRYVAAFEDYDIGALTDLFTAEATFQMPPFATWVQGPEYIERLVRVQCPARRPGDLVLVPTAANGQPAYGMYLRDSEGTHRAFGIHVLTLEQERIGHCSVFFDPTLFPFFDLALTLDR